MKNSTLDLLRIAPVAVYTCDNKGYINFYNEAAEHLWGRKPLLNSELFCGSFKTYQNDGTPLDLHQHPVAFLLKEKLPLTTRELIMECPDGSRSSISASSQPIIGDDEEIEGVVTVLIDISEKKLLEKRITESEDRYQQLAQSMDRIIKEKTAALKLTETRQRKMVEEIQDYAILLLDKEGFIVNWNKGAEKIKGYAENEIIGKNFRIFYLDEDRNNKLPERLLLEATLSGKAMHEGWRVRKDGTRFWGSIVLTAIHANDNSVIGFSKVTRDLTEKKMKDDQIANYAKELENQNKELAAYAYIASHDLQEPVRKIQVFASMLEVNMHDPAMLKQYIDKINKSAIKMKTLIRDVLDYSRVTNNEETLVPVDLNEVLESVKEEFDLKLEQENASFTHSHLPVVKGIPVQLKQLFSNLLGNSLKFSKVEPIIEITWDYASDADMQALQISTEQHYIKLYFKDNGIGFAPEYADDVFKLFRRLQSAQSGTGIGLALCKKIVENHHGHITVSSAVHEGTVFTIYLPVEQQHNKMSRP